MAFELTERIRAHLTEDEVVWFTTVTPSGRPTPRPVWFVWDGSTVVTYSPAGAYKLRHIATNDRVSLTFNSDFLGNDVAVVHGRAAVDTEAPPATKQRGYLDKYASEIARVGLTVADFNGRYSVAIRVTPDGGWSR